MSRNICSPSSPPGSLTFLPAPLSPAGAPAPSPSAPPPPPSLPALFHLQVLLKLRLLPPLLESRPLPLRRRRPRPLSPKPGASTLKSRLSSLPPLAAIPDPKEAPFPPPRASSRERRDCRVRPLLSAEPLGAGRFLAPPPARPPLPLLAPNFMSADRVHSYPEPRLGASQGVTSASFREEPCPRAPRRLAFTPWLCELSRLASSFAVRRASVIDASLSIEWVRTHSIEPRFCIDGPWAVRVRSTHKMQLCIFEFLRERAESSS